MTIWQAVIDIISRLYYYNYQCIYHMEVIYKNDIVLEFIAVIDTLVHK